LSVVVRSTGSLTYGVTGHTIECVDDEETAGCAAGASLTIGTVADVTVWGTETSSFDDGATTGSGEFETVSCCSAGGHNVGALLAEVGSP